MNVMKVTFMVLLAGALATAGLIICCRQALRSVDYEIGWGAAVPLLWWSLPPYVAFALGAVFLHRSRLASAAILGGAIFAAAFGPWSVFGWYFSSWSQQIYPPYPLGVAILLYVALAITVLVALLLCWWRRSEIPIPVAPQNSIRP